ncbi:MAG: hypothetical protein E7473_08720 [Ruminococcaceae bacterium]|nr:hypothetical protein [Oscillospiraceae bacterium]
MEEPYTHGKGKTYKFNAKERDLGDFNYAYSLLPKEHKEFDLREDCIANYKEGNPDEIDYVSIITKKKYKAGVTFSAKCSFEKFGAPLIVFTDDVALNEKGTLIYGLHFEAVAWEGGCNVWHVTSTPGAERPVKSSLIAFSEFKIDPNELADISVTVKKQNGRPCRLEVDINGHRFGCENVDIPEEFHIGITACEGANKFYEFSIEE